MGVGGGVEKEGYLVCMSTCIDRSSIMGQSRSTQLQAEGSHDEKLLSSRQTVAEETRCSCNCIHHKN